MLSGPLIVGGLFYLLPTRNARRAAVLVAAALLIGTTRKASWGRIDFHGAYFDVHAPALPKGALVIVGPYEPMAYAIPFLRPDARFVSPHNNFLHFSQKNLLVQRLAGVITSHAGPIFTLDFHGQSGVEASLAHFGLRRDTASCLGITSRIDTSAMRLCRVERVGR
jgi:hypothetical protein